MKKRALRKDFYMEIIKSLGRFLSIFFIVAIGVAFFSGIRSAQPDMLLSGDRYMDEHKSMDIKVISTLGLTQDDVNAISKIDGMQYAEGGYSVDAITTVDETQKVLHVASIQSDMNTLRVDEGSLPKSDDEIFLDYDFFQNQNYKLGDKIALESGNEDPITDTLKQEEFTIVGAGSSPAYISIYRGNTNIGTGSVNGFAYVTADAFDMEVFTEIYGIVQGAGELTSDTAEYDNLVEETLDRVDAIKEERQQIRYDDIYEEADKKLSDARIELEDAKKEAEEELADAKAKIDDGRTQIEDGKVKLADAKVQLADGKKELEEKLVELEDAQTQLNQKAKELEDSQAALNVKQQELNANQATLSAKQQQLNENQAALNVQQSELDKKQAELTAQSQVITQNQADLDMQWSQLNQYKSQYDALMNSPDNQNPEIAAQIAALQSVIDTMQPQLDTAQAQINDAKAQLDAGQAQINAGQVQINAGQAQINDGQNQINSAKAQISAGQSQINAGQAQINDGHNQIVSAQAEINDGRKQIEDGKTTLADSEKEIADNEAELLDKEQELADAQKEYEDGKKEAEDKIADGEREIEDAQDEIDDIEHPKWYTYDRSAFVEYDSFSDNADRIGAIGKVFPVMFFLVAALISLTSMTRMIEEHRILIGTYKALGYKKRDIAMKYLGYALLATLGGSVLGILAGEKIMPYVIIFSYEKIMYPHMDTIYLPYNMKYAVMATGAALICTLGATIFSCMKELHAQPAELMRPPAPKKGKRVFLERIPFIWKRLSFIWKATVRNLMRYKKRFFMTVFGIGGCMALLLVGYGLKDSIFDIAVYQYGDIQLYDGNIILEEDVKDNQREKVSNFLKENSLVSYSTSSLLTSVTVKSGKNEEDIYLNVPENVKDFEEVVSFHNRITKEPYQLSDKGVILTEKIAKMLNVSENDKIMILDEDKNQLEVTVEHICENYMGHYLYMSPELYSQVYGENPNYNSLMFDLKEYSVENELAVGEEALKIKGTLSVSYTSDVSAQLDDMLGSLDVVLLVLIISAGMLAFVVLYNLNNINITERKRELATLKVLGFYDKEVSSYVYRENIILTIIGAMAGVVMGMFLHRFVIVTVEIESVMFGRNIEFSSYIYSVLITIGFSFFVNWVMYYKLKKIDMVESLKSIE
ncbi:MAG: FtsX-like permease family protein [Lachnospiraceae bacterium]|nr:FtsX-like permease family protein [Lachnospiraceae bacterium]